MALISVTRLRVRSLRYLPGFFFYALRSSRQTKRAKGNLALGVLNDANLTFWTRTAWQDERTMREFMMTPPHRKAMAKLLDWCDEAALVHWVQDNAELPDWTEAHSRMQREGRPSKVRHPSQAQQAFEIAPPRVG